MKTTSQNKPPAKDKPPAPPTDNYNPMDQWDDPSQHLKTVNDLRILKQNGFYGVTLPVTRWLEGTTAQTAANYTTPFFIAHRPFEVVAVYERHEVAGSDAGAVTVQLKKVPSGTAPGSGTNILSAGFNLKATANTNQSTTGSSPAVTILQTIANNMPVRSLATGDALSLVSSGTLTAVEGVTVSVVLKSI